MDVLFLLSFQCRYHMIPSTLSSPERKQLLFLIVGRFNHSFMATMDKR